MELRSNDIAARFGGDEFAILLPETTADGAREIGGRLAEVLRERLGAAGFPLRLSIGVAAFGAHGLTLDDLARTADKALYAAKGSLRLGRIVNEDVALDVS